MIFLFSWNISLFYSLLEGFRTSFQNYHKTSCVILHMVEFSIILKLLSNLFLKTPTHQWVVGWATMPCMFILKIILTCAWKGGHYELCTWFSLCFQLVSQLTFILYTQMFSIYVYFNFQIVSISIDIYIFIHIYVIWVCLQYLYILKYKLCFMLNLI